MGHPVDFKVVTGNKFFTALAKFEQKSLAIIITLKFSFLWTKLDIFSIKKKYLRNIIVIQKFFWYKVMTRDHPVKGVLFR